MGLGSVVFMSEDSQVLHESTDSPVDAVNDASDEEAAKLVANAKSLVLEVLNDATAAVDGPANQHLGNSVDQLRIEFAAARIPMADIELWQPGRLVKFDEPNSAAVRVYIGENLVAEGELVDVAGKIGVRVLKQVEPGEREAA